MQVDYLIIGGGVAGLAAAIRLTEEGMKPLVIEAGNYPAHKVCGEFISPSGCALLKKWGITPHPIKKATFCFEKSSYTFPFEKEAGALSHISLDPQLAVLAKQQGAALWVETKVEEISAKGVRLSNHEWMTPKHLLIATGRFHKQEPCYYGYKAHFSGLDCDHLKMLPFKGGYMGIAPIEGGKYNVAALSDHPLSLKEHPALKGGKLLFKEWLEVKIGPFGMKKIPNLPDSYFIGDAAATIPPATGNGLTMALLSGILGAEFALKRDPQGYKKAFRQTFAAPLAWGRLVHELSVRPRLSPLVHLSPYLYQKIAL